MPRARSGFGADGARGEPKGTSLHGNRFPLAGFTRREVPVGAPREGRDERAKRREARLLQSEPATAMHTISRMLLGSLVLSLAVTACAVEEGDDDGAVAGESGLTSAVTPFYKDLTAAEMAGAKPLDAQTLTSATLFKHTASTSYELQILAAAARASGSVLAILYDADGHRLDVKPTALMSNNRHFTLQPYIAHAGTYFVRIAAVQASSYPLELAHVTRLRLSMTPIDVPVPSCEVVPTQRELDKLLSTNPVALPDGSSAAAASPKIKTVRLGTYGLSRFERDEAPSCLLWGEGCGAWAETKIAELDAGLLAGDVFLRRDTTYNMPEYALVASGVRKAPHVEYRLRGGVGFRSADSSLPALTSQIGTDGFLVPSDAFVREGSFERSQNLITNDTYMPFATMKGVVGKNCARLFERTTKQNTDGSLHVVVTTLGAVFGEQPPPPAPKVVINEVMAQGTAAKDEFVELYNPNDAPVSLAGYSLVSVSSSGAVSSCYVGKSADTIPAKGYFVVGGQAFAGPRDAALTCAGFAPLEGRIAIRDSSGRTLDGLGYGETETSAPTEGYYRAVPPANGRSMSRRTDGLDTNVNASDFGVAKPTPGAKNAL